MTKTQKMTTLGKVLLIWSAISFALVTAGIVGTIHFEWAAWIATMNQGDWFQMMSAVGLLSLVTQFVVFVMGIDLMSCEAKFFTEE